MIASSPQLNTTTTHTVHWLSSQKSSIAIAIAIAMAAAAAAVAVAANVSSSIIKCPNFQHINSFRFSRQIPNYRNPISSSIPQNNHHLLTLITLKTTKKISIINCSATNKPSSSSSSTEISSTAKIRSEVLSPFRTVRMFFYLAFIASGSLGGLIATTKLIGALSRSGDVGEILSGLGIDLGAVAIFAFLYSRDNNARNAQLARLSREENLSNLKLRINENKVIPVSALRGFARLVVIAGPGSYIMESFKRSLPFSDRLIERGVLVVPFATDGNLPQFEFEENDETDIEKRKRLWQLVPVIAADWSGWLEDQKKLAKVSPDSPVYISLRLDGRVRGSGIGYPPWNAFVAQLPPVKGLWLGLLDGMDGRV